MSAKFRAPLDRNAAAEGVEEKGFLFVICVFLYSIYNPKCAVYTPKKSQPWHPYAKAPLFYDTRRGIFSKLHYPLQTQKP
jgi:hypothetical protein